MMMMMMTMMISGRIQWYVVASSCIDHTRDWVSTLEGLAPQNTLRGTGCVV
jgi:hypothetical protein